MRFSFELRQGSCRALLRGCSEHLCPGSLCAKRWNGKPPEPQKPATDAAKADTAKEGQKKIDEIAEAARP